MTFDLDDTTPEPDTSTVDGLIQELHNQETLLIAVATGDQHIQAVEAEYRQRRQRLMHALERHSLQYPFPWSDLWLWYDYWKTNLPGYASRRTCIKQLVGPVLDALERQRSGLTVVDSQSEESTSQERITRTMLRQEGTDIIKGEEVLPEKQRLKQETEQATRKQEELNLPPEHSETLTLFKTRQQTALQDLEYLLFRFHRVAKHFSRPDRSGNSLPVQVEADVQHILHGLLLSRFDDIRPEDFIPYRAGARSRVDFLLEEEKIFIETKMTRKGLDDNEVGSQLIIDIERYQAYPKCQILVCFVYDPQSYIKNPVALKKDLEKPQREIQVKVIIYQP